MIKHVLHVGGKVQVVPGKGAADIVFFPVPVGHAVLQVLHDLVIGAFSVHIGTHAVMHFLPAVQGQDEADVVVGEIFHLLLIQQHAVGGEGHFDFLVVFLFLLMDVINGLLHHMPVHERFAAEEIQFAVFSGAAVGNEEIHASSCHVKGHEHAPLAVAALPCKAVLAAEIAVMGNVQAQRLDDRPVFNGHFIVGVHRRKEDFLLNQFIQVIHHFIQFLFLIGRRQIGQHHITVFSVIKFQYLICYVIHHMNNAAVYIHHNVHAVLTETMNHGLYIIIHE